MKNNEVVAFIKMNPFHHRLNPCKPDYIKSGEYNGYVAFKGELPLSWQGGADFDDNNALDKMVAVHGGITLDDSMESLINDPLIPITEIPEPEVFKHYRVIGFDTCHLDDCLERWPIEEVKQETLRLKAQIENLLNKNK